MPTTRTTRTTTTTKQSLEPVELRSRLKSSFNKCVKKYLHLPRRILCDLLTTFHPFPCCGIFLHYFTAQNIFSLSYLFSNFLISVFFFFQIKYFLHKLPTFLWWQKTTKTFYAISVKSRKFVWWLSPFQCVSCYVTSTAVKAVAANSNSKEIVFVYFSQPPCQLKN
jgi:hypothetical protein